MDVPALTVNKVCLSGIDAIALADQLIRAGEFDVVVAGGMESMTNAPHLLTGSREGFKYGDVRMLDHMAYDGLWDIFTDQAMGGLTEARNAERDGLTREEQDAFSRAVAPAGGRGLEERPVRPTRSCRWRSRSAAATRSSSPRTRASGPTRRWSRWPSCARLQQGRHDHRRVGLADLRRRLRRGRDEQGQGGGAGSDLVGGDRRARRGRRAGLHAAEPAGARPSRAACAKEGIEPSPTSTWSRSTRRSRRWLIARRPRAGVDEDEGQRQRRCHRRRPPDRHVRSPDHPAPGPRAEAARWRGRRGRAVRWRRSGRRPDRAGAGRADPRRPSPLLVERARAGSPAGRRPLDIAGRERGHRAARGDGAAVPHAGQAEVIGVTGRPGWASRRRPLRSSRRSGGARVGVLAVDPTSPFSGGAAAR
jgi:hypothetical protein